MTFFLDRAVEGFIRALEIVMVLCMVLMLTMVFGNVMLRFLFNTGIDLSEEFPRFAFVWMTFLGAIVGVRRHAHLGVDIVVRLLPRFGQRLCWGISQSVMCVCSAYMLYGTWLQHDIIASNSSPVAQISMLWVFGVSYLTGSAIFLFGVANLLRLFAGRVDDRELIDVREEGMAEVEAEGRAGA